MQSLVVSLKQSGTLKVSLRSVSGMCVCVCVCVCDISGTCNKEHNTTHTHTLGLTPWSKLSCRLAYIKSPMRQNYRMNIYIYIYIYIYMWAGIAKSVCRLATAWTVRGSNPSDRSCGPPSLVYKGYRVFPAGKSADSCH